MTKKDVVLAMMKAHNDHDVEAVKKLATPDAVYASDGNADIPWADFADALGALWKSFPDMKWSWDDVSPEGNFVNPDMNGTHTANAYGFGDYAAIPATGAKVKFPNERWEFVVVDGKVQKWAVSPPPGARGGPPGVYEQIGGKL